MASDAEIAASAAATEEAAIDLIAATVPGMRPDYTLPGGPDIKFGEHYERMLRIAKELHDLKLRMAGPFEVNTVIR